MLWAMLFAQVPEAKVVHEADIAARRGDSIGARVFDAGAGMPYHQWSVAWTEEIAAEMNPRISGSLEAGETFTLLLADAVSAIRFTGSGAAEVLQASRLNEVARFDGITTTNALYSGLELGVSAERMIELGVLYLRPAVSPSPGTFLF